MVMIHIIAVSAQPTLLIVARMARDTLVGLDIVNMTARTNSLLIYLRRC